MKKKLVIHTRTQKKAKTETDYRMKNWNVFMNFSIVKCWMCTTRSFHNIFLSSFLLRRIYTQCFPVSQNRMVYCCSFFYVFVCIEYVLSFFWVFGQNKCVYDFLSSCTRVSLIYAHLWYFICLMTNQTIRRAAHIALSMSTMNRIHTFI